MNRLRPVTLIAQASLIVLLFIAISIYYSVGGADYKYTGSSLEPSSENSKIRTKRSPFVVAFQVTRPPGLFQLSMRKKVIMGVMSNMTSMILGSEIARMFSRGFSAQQFLFPLNISNTTNLTTEVEVAK